jgi:hypothetical protein
VPGLPNSGIAVEAYQAIPRQALPPLPFCGLAAVPKAAATGFVEGLAIAERWRKQPALASGKQLKASFLRRLPAARFRRPMHGEVCILKRPMSHQPQPREYVLADWRDTGSEDSGFFEDLYRQLTSGNVRTPFGRSRGLKDIRREGVHCTETRRCPGIVCAVSLPRQMPLC